MRKIIMVTGSRSSYLCIDVVTDLWMHKIFQYEPVAWCWYWFMNACFLYGWMEYLLKLGWFNDLTGLGFYDSVKCFFDEIPWNKPLLEILRLVFVVLTNQLSRTPNRNALVDRVLACWPPLFVPVATHGHYPSWRKKIRWCAVFSYRCCAVFSYCGLDVCV